MSKTSTKFHIENNDYFGTLATILNLFKQTVNNRNLLKRDINFLNKLEKDLLFLQKEYKIVKK